MLFTKSVSVDRTFIFRCVHKIAKCDHQLHVCLSAWNWAPTWWIFMKSDIWVFFTNYYLTRITGNLHKDQYIYFIISHSILHRMRNVSYKSCTANQNTHFMSRTFFFNCVIYESTWKTCCRAGQTRDGNIAHVQATNTL